MILNKNLNGPIEFVVLLIKLIRLNVMIWSLHDWAFLIQVSPATDFKQKPDSGESNIYNIVWLILIALFF